jgi:hypothetical protein
MEALTNQPTNENHGTGYFGQKLEEKKGKRPTLLGGTTTAASGRSPYGLKKWRQTLAVRSTSAGKRRDAMPESC